MDEARKQRAIMAAAKVVPVFVRDDKGPIDYFERVVEAVAAELEPPDTLHANLALYKTQFGGGMVPFDSAYHEAYNPHGGPGEGTMSEAWQAGGYALLEAFVKFVEYRAEHGDKDALVDAKGNFHPL